MRPGREGCYAVARAGDADRASNVEKTGAGTGSRSRTESFSIGPAPATCSCLLLFLLRLLSLRLLIHRPPFLLPQIKAAQ